MPVFLLKIILQQLQLQNQWLRLLLLHRQTRCLYTNLLNLLFY